MEFPLEYFHKNIIFNKKQQAYAIYKVPQWPYNFLKDNQKKQFLKRFEEFLHGFSGYGQILYLINPIEFIEERYLRKAGTETRKPELLKEAHNHAVAAQEYVQSIHSWKREIYVVLQLPLTGWGRRNFKNTFQEIKEVTTNLLIGKKDIEIKDKTIQEAEALEKELYYQHSNNLGLSRIDNTDLDRIIRRNLHREWEYPPPLPPKDGGMFDQAKVLALDDGIMIKENINNMQIINPDGREYWQAMLTLVDMPNEVPELNFEWVANLNFLDQPVDAVIHFNSIPSFEASKGLRLRKGMLKDQMQEYSRGGEETSLDMEWAQNESRVLENKLGSGMSLLRLGCTIAVSAKDEVELQSNVKQIIQYFQTSYLKFVRPPGDQLKMFYSFLPGANPATSLIECDPGYLASAGVQAGFEVGDDNGFILGHVLNGIPVMWNPGEAMQQDYPGTTVITGLLGGGKSVLKKYFIYLAALKNARIYSIDPKNEDFIFSKLPFRTRQVDFSYTGNAKINPLQVSNDPTRARDIARDYLGIILKVGDNEARQLVINDALEYVYELPQEKQNLFSVVDWLERCDDNDTEKNNEASRCAKLLRAYMNSSLGKLVFTNENLQIKDEQISVMNISELPLPQQKDNNTAITESERQALGLLFLTAATARETMFRSKKGLKVFAVDEAWALMDIPEGARLIKELVRMSRSFGIIPILVTQNGSDIKEKAIRNNVGYVYCFRANDLDEIKGNAELLQANTEGEEILQAFRRLDTGQCVMRDPVGRIGVAKIIPLPGYLLDIFSTKPAAREEEAG